MITHKVSNRKQENAMSYERVKEYFEQVGLPERVEAAIGHAPGAVCPFAIRDGVSVYLDVSLRRFSITFAAGGSLGTAD